MSSARALYERFRHLIHEGAKFGIVGLTGILVTNLVFGPLHNELGLGVLTSVTVATIVATVVTFLGNRYWSFRDREGSGTGKEGLMFFVLNGIGLLIQYAVLGFGNYALGLTGKLENQLMVNIGIGIGTLFRFWSYRKWVWVPPEVRLAQLRRGRHRKGRPAIDPASDPASDAASDPVQAEPGSAPPAPARPAPGRPAKAQPVTAHAAPVPPLAQAPGPVQIPVSAQSPMGVRVAVRRGSYDQRP